jgi:hypothetical protein
VPQEERIEGRYDWSDQKTFVKAPPTDTSPAVYEDNQSEIALQGVYKF